MTPRPDTLRAELCEAFGVTVVHVARTGSWIAIAERGDAKHEVMRPTRAAAEDAALDLCGVPHSSAQSLTPAPYPICGKVRHRVSASGHDYTAACPRTEACDVADCPLRPATPEDAEAACWEAVHHYAHGGVLCAAPHLRDEARRRYKATIRAYGDARARARAASAVPEVVRFHIRRVLVENAISAADGDALRAWLRAAAGAEGVK